MKIIFDLRRTGLGNNGGSSTLIKSGNALVDMGHDVTFIDSFKNQHTWTKLKTKHIRPKKIKGIPDADAIIATGYRSVVMTRRVPERCGIKLHWIRGWETWVLSEDKIVENILNAPTKKIVNSICLQRKLKHFGFDSKIIRPGYDLGELINQRKRQNKVIRLGGLYTRGKHEAIKRTEWIYQTFNHLNKKYNNVELWLFGNQKIMGHPEVGRYFHRPSVEEKNWFYNRIDIWLAPAMQEGLHLPPAEAMMTGCPVVTTNAEMSGTQDYVIHGDTGLVSKNNFKSFIKSAEKLYQKTRIRLHMGNNTRKKIESLGSRKENMQKLIDYIMELK